MKWDRVHKYLFGLLAGGLLGSLAVGCTAEPVEDIVPEEARLVQLSFGNPDLGVPAVLTRAGETVGTPTPLPAGTTVRIGAYFTGNVGDKLRPASFATDAPSFEATYVVGEDGALRPCRVDDAGKEVAGEAKGLQVRGGVYDFYAVSPARKLAKGSDTNYKITGIPHKEDVMAAFARGVAVTKDVRLVRLGTFRRKCALVVFNVAPSPDNAMPFERLYGTRLELKRISSAGASLIAGEDTGIPPTGGSDEEEARLVFTEDEFEPVESDLHGAGLNKTKGVLIPKNNQAFDVEINVVRDDETAILKATIDKGISFDEGKRYVFTLEVKNNESSLLMKVLDWNAIVFKDENVGGPDDPYDDPDINEGIGTTIVVAKWTEVPWSGNGDIGGTSSLTVSINPATALAATKDASGTYTLNGTSGLPYSFTAGFPSWLIVTNGTASISGGTTTGSDQQLTYKTASVNPDGTERKATVTVKAGDISKEVEIKQSASSFTVDKTEIELEETATSGTVNITGTNGLPWTVSPSVETNGITPETTSGTASGSAQTLTFSATENTGVARSATFTIAVTGGDHSKTVKVKQAAALTGTSVRINQSVLTSYRTKTTDMATYPPFNIEGTNHLPNGSTFDGTATMTGSYIIQVQKGQRSSANNYSVMQSYCSGLDEDGTGWRLPTQIELHAMYMNRAKIEGSAGASTFVSSTYWSSSVYSGDSGRRCLLLFASGNFGYYTTDGYRYVRCVRDKN